MEKQIYIIGDVHGCFDTLMALVAKLPENADLVFCGDLIDRGPKSRDVINFVRENNYDVVMGNHEEMMIDYVVDGEAGWLENGGVACLRNYPTDEEMLIDIKWLMTLPKLILLDEYKDKMGRSLLISHAPVLDFFEYYMSVKEKIINEDYTQHQLIDYDHTVSNCEQLMVWNRNIPKKENTKYFNVFGHTPIDSFCFDKYSEYKVKPEVLTPDNIAVDILKGYANIDTGACYTDLEYSKLYRGRLTALEFPSMRVIQQENIDGF